jgi:catechol 2,3-dioxygenase-like lactoylglutathione lyase family enzyme
MKVLPIRYVRDMTASRQFYLALGLAPDARPDNDYWCELGSASGGLALHHAMDDGSGVDLTLLSDEEPLEAVVARLDANGIAHAGISEERFGRSLKVTDPDGLVVQINEHAE